MPCLSSSSSVGSIEPCLTIATPMARRICRQSSHGWRQSVSQAKRMSREDAAV